MTYEHRKGPTSTTVHLWSLGLVRPLLSRSFNAAPPSAADEDKSTKA